MYPLSAPRERVEQMMAWCEGKEHFESLALLFLLAYVFLLRLPSEALPVTAGSESGQSSLFRDGETVVLELKRRKNKVSGSRLVRKCWGQESEACLLT